MKLSTEVIQENGIIGRDFYTIDQLSIASRDRAITRLRQRKEREFWVSKPMLDQASEEALELEFEMTTTDDKLIKELLDNNVFFNVDGFEVNIK